MGGSFQLLQLSLPPSAAGLTEALRGTDLSHFRSAGTGAPHPVHCIPCALHALCAAQQGGSRVCTGQEGGLSPHAYWVDDHGGDPSSSLW